MAASSSASAAARRRTWSKPSAVEKEESRELANEALEAVMKMFENEHFPGYKGKHFDLPAAPRAAAAASRRPHPPLWIAASNLSTYEHAAKQGVGIIGVTRNSIAETRSAIRTYRETIRTADPKKFVGKTANESVAAFALACCHEDDRTGKDIACAAARWYNGDNDAELNNVRFATAGGKEAVVAKFRARSQRPAARRRNGDRRKSGLGLPPGRAMGQGRSRSDDLRAAGREHDPRAGACASIDLIGEKVIPRFEVKAHAAA